MMVERFTKNDVFKINQNPQTILEFKRKLTKGNLFPVSRQFGEMGQRQFSTHTKNTG